MKRLSILIVDDEKRYADMLSRRLMLRGMDCAVCLDGQSALQSMKARDYHVVLLDLQLPDMYGTEVLTQLKRDWPDTNVVIITGHGSDGDHQTCMAGGAYAFLNKPVDIEKLTGILVGIGADLG